MRVLLVNYEYPPLGGGAAVATRALADGLARRGVDVHVLTAEGAQVGAPGPSGRAPRLHTVDTRRRDVHDAGLGAAVRFVVRAWPVLGRLLREQPFDVVHYFFSLPTGVLLPPARRAGVPTVVSLRGSDVPGYDPENRGLERMHRALAPLTRWVWRRADLVVSVCESLGRLAQQTDPTLSFEVVGNGVDTRRFRPADGKRSDSPEVVRCIAVSRLTPRKNLDTLIRAFARLPRGRYRLEVVGSGTEETALQSLAAALALGADVEFAGAVDHGELPEHYRRADLFTLVPHSEAYGNVFAEAIASGLPIVGSDVGGVTELVEHDRNGLLVHPDDPAALALAIECLGEDPALRARIAKQNREKAETLLSSERVPDRYLELYQSLSGRRTPRAPARSR